MKRIVTIVALICAVAFQLNGRNSECHRTCSDGRVVTDEDKVNAQDTVEEKKKAAEAAVKLADENPEDCKKQYIAAWELANVAADDSSKFEQALAYAYKALEIAKAHKERKDTLLAEAYSVLGTIYQKQGSVDNACDFMELSVDATEELLGRYDPLTIYNRLKVGLTIKSICPDTRRSFLHIMQAFYDNDKAPANKRIKNLGVVDIYFNIAMEELMAAHVNSNRYTLLVVMIDGKSYYVMQTRDWHIGQPLTNWLTPNLLRSEKEREAHSGEDIILMNEKGEFRRLTKKEGQNLRLVTPWFRLDPSSNEMVITTPDPSHLVSFPPETYNEILERFNEFINKK